MRHRSSAVFLTLLSFLFPDSSPAQENPVFSEHIAPIIFGKCAGCHREGQAAPFTLLNYAQVKKRAKQIGEATSERIMPPWHADPGVVEYANDRSLTKEQIDLIGRWVAAGTPEGDPAKTPALPKFPEGWQLGQPDMIYKTSEPYKVPAEGSDVYRNFVVPLNLDKDTWVKAIEFRPGAPSVVHHVLYFLDTKGKARGYDAADPLPGYNGMGRANGNFRYLGGWDLGTQQNQLGYGLAWLLPKGSDLVLQVHYHPSGKEALDQDTIGFHLSDKPTARPWSIVPVPPFFGILSGIHIPAGEKEYIKQSSFVLPADLEAFAVNAHAHYLGKRMEMTATLPGGEKRWLLKMSGWHFAWQEDYAFKQPVKLPKGTTIDVLISWDNTDANPHQYYHPPKDIRWGPRSMDEMGTITLSVMMDTPEQKAALHKGLKQMLTGQFVQRVFENDMRSFATIRTQISEDMKVPNEGGFAVMRQFVLPLDANKDGVLSTTEMQPAVDFMLPRMRGFGEIGLD
jgi:hypothetical protein